MTDLNKVKSRYWACVVYADSAPSDWIDLLEQTGLPCAISPYHDLDINPTGEPKKPHWHVILAWDGPTTYQCVRRIVCDQLHAPSPMKIEHVGGYYRYLTHEDNPEKEQYDKNQIRLLNGFCIEDYITESEREIDALNDYVLTFIQVNLIYEYSDLIDDLRERGETQALRFARRNTIYLNCYLTSKRNKAKDKDIKAGKGQA